MGKKDHGPDPVLPFERSQTPGRTRIHQGQAQEKALTPQVEQKDDLVPALGDYCMEQDGEERQ